MPTSRDRSRGSHGTAALRALQSLLSCCVVPTGNPELLRSQFAALTRQLPVLYFILIMNVLSTGLTHFRSAPLWMSAWVPGALCAMGLVRMVSWMGRRNRTVAASDAAHGLQATVLLTPLLTLVLVFWAIGIFPYGDAYAQCQVAFFVAMTMVGCIFCLTPIRAVALLSMLIAVIPFSVFFLETGNIALLAIAVNIFLAAFGMTFILLRHHGDFSKLVESQKTLLLKHEETERLSTENVRIANRDSLTDLPNRRGFFAALEALIGHARACGSSFAVGLIDLDGFKAVNDVYGHSAGDRVLVEATRRLQARASDTVLFARLGGDEFGLIVDRAMPQAELMELAREICLSLEEPFLLPGGTPELSGSIGFAIFPEVGTSAETLFEHADYALYYAKQNLRGAAVIFSGEHETRIREASLLEQELRQADLDREMSLVYQPIHDAGTGRTVAFEALARWTSPTRGPVPPDLFIGVAERSGLINRLTETLLKRALAAARAWPPHVGISFNLSARDLASTAAIEAVTRSVARSGVEPWRISFEITETMVMRDFDQGCEALQGLRQLGAGISLDDFGTGYSSLGYVHRLPIDRIKIDRSFVADIETSASSRSIVTTVVSLCRNLGLDCIVEGVETEAQARILREVGCVMMQGYLFARPMTEAAVLQHLAGQEAAGRLQATG